MRIVSNNLWNCDRNYPWWEQRGEDCSAAARVERLAAVYRELDGDIYGFQEMSRLMEPMLSLQLGDIFGHIPGGYTPIFYRRDRVSLTDSGYVCFPKTAEGVEGEVNDADSKGFSYGVFREKATGKAIAVLSLHLWWMFETAAEAGEHDDWVMPGSDRARAIQLATAADRARALAKAYDCPAMIVGDFNMKYAHPTMTALLAGDFSHAHDISVGARDETRGTHFCYPNGWRHDEPGVLADSIDQAVLTNRGNATVTAFGRYENPAFDTLSDHYPLWVDLKL